MVFETLNVRKEGGVLVARIPAPPLNLREPELVRYLVSLIEQAEADRAVKEEKMRAALDINLPATPLAS